MLQIFIFSSKAKNLLSKINFLFKKLILLRFFSKSLKVLGTVSPKT